MAFITIDSDDSIANIPSNSSVSDDLKIVGTVSNTLIGNNWSDLLDASIENSIETATGSDKQYWTGVNSSGDGEKAEETCSNWTTDSYAGGEENLGRVGSKTSTTQHWLSLGNDDCSNTTFYRVLCIAWDD